jgi:hypothetical protein
MEQEDKRLRSEKFKLFCFLIRRRLQRHGLLSDTACSFAHDGTGCELSNDLALAVNVIPQHEPIEVAAGSKEHASSS